MKNPLTFRRLAPALLVVAFLAQPAVADAAPPGYDGLVKLFEDWRDFEHPPLKDGAPDYTAATFERRHAELKAYRDRLEAYVADLSAKKNRVAAFEALAGKKISEVEAEWRVHLSNLK